MCTCVYACSSALATDSRGLSKRHRLPKFLSTSVRTLSARAGERAHMYRAISRLDGRCVNKRGIYVGWQGLELSAPVFRANMRSAVGPVRHLTRTISRDQHSLDEARGGHDGRSLVTNKQYRLPWTRLASSP